MAEPGSAYENPKFEPVLSELQLLYVEMIFISICKLLLYKIERKSWSKIYQLTIISVGIKRIAFKSQILIKKIYVDFFKNEKILLKELLQHLDSKSTEKW